MLDSTKINFSQKKLSGKQHAWNSKKWYEEDDGIVLFQHAKEIWVDRVNETPPSIETDLIRPILNLNFCLMRRQVARLGDLSR